MAQHRHFIEKTAHDFDVDEVSRVLHELLLKTIEEQKIDPGEKWTEAKIPDQELTGSTSASGADKVRLAAFQASIKNRVNNRQWNQKAYHKFLKFFKKRSVRDFVDLALVPASAFGGGAITGPAVSGISGMSAPGAGASEAASKAWDLANQAGSFVLDCCLYVEGETGGNVEDAITEVTSYDSLKKKLRGNSINAVMKELIEDGETHIKRSARQLGSAAESFGILREWEQTVKQAHEQGDNYIRRAQEDDEHPDDPWEFLNCDEAITLGFLACNFLHHYDKLRAHSWEVFKYVNFLSSRIGEWNALWETMRDTSHVATHLKEADHSKCGSLCYGPKDGQPAVAKNPLSSWVFWETNLGLSRSQVKGQEKVNEAELEETQTEKVAARAEKQEALGVAEGAMVLTQENLVTFDQEKALHTADRENLLQRQQHFQAAAPPSDPDEKNLLPFKLEYLEDQLAANQATLDGYDEGARKELTDKLTELEQEIIGLKGELESLDQELGVIAVALDSGPESKIAKSTVATTHAKGDAPKARSARIKRCRNWFSVTGLQDPSAEASALRVKGTKGKQRVNKDMVQGKAGIEFKGTRLEESAGDETPGRLNRLLSLLNDIWWPIEHKSRGHRVKRRWGRWSMYREHAGRKALRFSIMALGAAAGTVIIIATGGAAAPVVAIGIGAGLWSADKLSGDKLDRRFAKNSQEKLDKLTQGAGEAPGEVHATIAIEAHQGAKASLKRGAAVRRQFASCEKNFQRMLYFSHKRVHPRDSSKSLEPFKFADCEDAASFMWAVAKFRRHYCKLVHYITPITLYTGTLLQSMQAMEAYWWGADGYKDETVRGEGLDTFDGAAASDPPENMRGVVMGAIKKVVFEDKAWHDRHCGTTPKDRSDRTFRIRRRGRNNIKKPYANQRSALCYGPVQSNATDDSGIPFKHKHKIRRQLNLSHTFSPNTTNIQTSGSGAVPDLLDWAWGHGWSRYLAENRKLAEEAADPAADISELLAAIAEGPQIPEAPLDEAGAAEVAAEGPGDEEEIEQDGSDAAQVTVLEEEPVEPPEPVALEEDAGLAVLAAITLGDPDQALLGPEEEADPTGGDVQLEPQEYAWIHQGTTGEDAKLCAFFALYHFFDGTGITRIHFKSKAAQMYKEKLGMSDQDAMDLALDGNDPGVLGEWGLNLIPDGDPDRLGSKDVVIIARKSIGHFYCIRKVDGDWWNFDSLGGGAFKIVGDPLQSMAAQDEVWA